MEQKYKKVVLDIFFLAVCLCGLSAKGLLIAGTEKGLYDISDYVSKPLLKNVDIKKICKTTKRWLFLTNKGIVASKNLKEFYFFNKGLPTKTIKEITDGEKKLITKTARLVDLEIHPEDANIAVTATSSAVYLTEDGGRTWRSLGCNGNINGIKAVAVTHLPDRRKKNTLTRICFSFNIRRGVAAAA